MKTSYLWVSACFLMGCMKIPDNTVNFGPQFSEQQVFQARSQAATVVDARKAAQNEFVHLAVTQSILGGPISVVGEVARTIIERKENAKIISLAVAQDLVEYNKNQTAHKVTQGLVIVDKETGGYALPFALPSSLLNSMLSSIPSFEHSSLLSFYSQLGSGQQVEAKSEAKSEAIVTYHNLEVSEMQEDVPELAKQKLKCELNCQIKTLKVKYDKVNWKSPTDGEKETLWFKVSPDVPWLAQPHEMCNQFAVVVQNRHIIATICNTVVNYEFGDPVN